jgi:hypothetical protein
MRATAFFYERVKPYMITYHKKSVCLLSGLRQAITCFNLRITALAAKSRITVKNDKQEIKINQRRGDK